MIVCMILFVFFTYLIRNGYTNEPTIVHTKYGDILGYQTNLARIFYGIPFAQAPINELRWNSPVPITKWFPKVINATSRAPACPQPPCNPSSPLCPPHFSEDCLYLNIFTPLTTLASQSTPLPVMIFIPGGEFQHFDASASIYNAERLVNTTNVIVAFIQYRLGVLGFFATGTGPNDIKGNYGILDQRLAIAWIKANINAFGGDPNEITLFGQSAGAQSVALHYVARDMQSFFQRVIIQSAPMAIPFRTYAQYITPGVFLAEQLHCSFNDIACFRAATVDNITAAQEIVNGKITSLEVLLLFEPWVPVIDNIIVHGQLYETIQNLSFPIKPLIMGTVTDEGLVFIYNKWNQPILPKLYAEIAFAFFRGKALKVLERYPPVGEGDQRSLLSQIATQWVFACPTRIFARKAALYSYVFGYPLNSDKKKNEDICNGHVCHGDELSYLFESNWINFTDAGQRVSQSIANYWTNFAKTQNPNQPLSVPIQWPIGNNTYEKYMYFQDPLQVKDNYLEDDCDFWDQIGYRKDF
ncbi:unnamed protein product [Rotaria sp. Silwood2]|nr:unnamed protein product [Rotaria sp. Silwood2]CAF2850803.1 unnamed protein product [Rotaria sp. Silwood2]CAF3220022.1 unnamed protein product [Rotaria sp. Silwood2]CAF4188446.1 unnamed protein product [Rotaria sp. Silwood2]CAF4443352.1 unnamed protein product [Rotaria sp. Silwood2]